MLIFQGGIDALVLRRSIFELINNQMTSGSRNDGNGIVHVGAVSPFR